MKTNYGYWFWLNLNFDEGLLNTAKLIFLVFLLIFTISLVYSLTSQIKFKYQVINYLLNAFLFSNIALSIFFLNNYLQVYKDNEFFTAKLRSFPNSDLLISGHVYMSIVIIVFALIVFILDYFILKRIENLTQRFLIRTSNFLFVIFLLCLTFLLVTNNYSSKTLFLLTSVSSVLLIFGFIRSIFLYFKERNHALLREKDVQLSQLTASKAKADKTEKMALSLSNLFRHNLNRKDETYSSIQEEVEAVKAYLEIEQIRFGERLQYNIEVDETLNELQIPRNIIQPLIENAVKHGISEVEEQGILKLAVSQNKDAVEISVYDNGPAFPGGIVSGYGLQSIFDILELSYNDKASLSWESEPQKRIWINIQKNELKKGHDAL